jgi:hypothetical protein
MKTNAGTKKETQRLCRGFRTVHKEDVNGLKDGNYSNKTGGKINSI